MCVNYLGKFLVELVDALQKRGANVRLIAPCGNQAKKALDRIDVVSKKTLSVPLARASSLSLAHGQALSRSDKEEGVLEKHISSLRLICHDLCGSDTEDLEPLNASDYGSVTYDCGLSAGHMSKERRSAATEKARRTSQAKPARSADAKAETSRKLKATLAAKSADAKAETSRKLKATLKARSEDAKTVATRTYQAAQEKWRREKNAGKPNICMAPASGTVTIAGGKEWQAQANCTCAYDDAEIGRTVQQGYSARVLRWSKTKEFGEEKVLVHYKAIGNSMAVCGIICDGNTRKPVRRGDFE